MSRIGPPSSQVIVNSRRVDSSGIGRGTATPGSSFEDRAVEPHMRGLALVIELLAQPVGDLGVDLGGADRAVVALVEPHREFKLAQIGFDRRAHVRILQFAGERGAVERDRPVHLAERGRARRLMLEIAKRLCQSGPSSPIMRRRTNGQPIAGAFDLELDQLADIFLGQRVGDRREQLRHLHQRPLDPAERRLQIGRVAPAIDRNAEIALARRAAPPARPSRSTPAHSAATRPVNELSSVSTILS